MTEMLFPLSYMPSSVAIVRLGNCHTRASSFGELLGRMEEFDDVLAD